MVESLGRNGKQVSYIARISIDKVYGGGWINLVLGTNDPIFFSN